MDSWFTLISAVALLVQHIDVIGMVKKTPMLHYIRQDRSVDLMAIYRRLKKRRGRAKILACTIVCLKGGRRVKLVFIRDNHKKDWLAPIFTDSHCYMLACQRTN